MTNVHVNQFLEQQDKEIDAVKRQCIEQFGEGVLIERLQPFYNETMKSHVCPAFWDSLVCWPPTPAGNVAVQACPSYFTGFLAENDVSRRCMDNGVWYINRALNTTWTNYTACMPNDSKTTVYVNHNQTEVPPELKNYMPLIIMVSKTGYVVSLVTLIVAFAIMLFIKKLHCARNILHMHLFASFILRASVFMIKSASFVSGLGLKTDLINHGGVLYFNVDSETNNWACKLVTSLWQYSLIANYSWILMEGLYLYNLIFKALFADSSNSIKLYVIMGWGLPLIIIACWITARLLLEDALCWTKQETQEPYLIINIPIIVSNLINFVLFSRISMVLYSKLRSPLNEENRRYKKWAKSTLILVPLFGVHYGLLLILYKFYKTHPIVELVWLMMDRMFGSFEGFFVAILYCFLNGEVKAEIQPHLYYFLTFMATNKYSQYFFPCRKKFLRSVMGRASVCTTMSCSSLYTNGVLHRSSKCRLDSIPKVKQGDKTKDHFCHNGASRRNSKTHRHSQPYNFMAETALCIEQNKCRSEPEINEESRRMMVHNNF